MWPVGLMRTLDKREEKVEVIQEEQERGCGDEGNEIVEAGKWIF